MKVLEFACEYRFDPDSLTQWIVQSLDSVIQSKWNISYAFNKLKHFEQLY